MAEALPWILIGVVGALVILVAMVFVFKKKGMVKEDTDYRAFFLMGVTWMMIGIPMFVFYGYEFNALFAMGIIFFITGLANKGKWKKEPLTKTNKISWILAILAIIVLAAVVAYIKLVVQA